MSYFEKFLKEEEKPKEIISKPIKQIERIPKPTRKPKSERIKEIMRIIKICKENNISENDLYFIEKSLASENQRYVYWIKTDVSHRGSSEALEQDLNIIIKEQEEFKEVKKLEKSTSENVIEKLKELRKQDFKLVVNELEQVLKKAKLN